MSKHRSDTPEEPLPPAGGSESAYGRRTQPGSAPVEQPASYDPAVPYDQEGTYGHAHSDPRPYDPTPYEATPYDPTAYGRAPQQPYRGNDDPDAGYGHGEAAYEEAAHEEAYPDDVYGEEVHADDVHDEHHDEPPLLPGGAAPPPGNRGRRSAKKKRRRPIGCLLIAVVVLVLFAGGLYVVVDKLGGALGGLGGDDAEDYEGGTAVSECATNGDVQVDITEGDSIREMGDQLAEKDVVASSDAFVAAASANDNSSSIQVGTRLMCAQMSATEAVDLLVDNAYVNTAGITIPEGFRVDAIVARIVENTDFTEEELQALLDDPDSIGLPAEADGNPEGYLYPATYPVNDDTTAQSLLSDMVAKTVSVEEELDIASRAQALGYTAHEIITIASLLEYEANNAEDYAKVARVIYNRLDQDMPLQFDSTISYLADSTGEVWTTAEQRAIDSPYNTYLYQGLPPGPIGSPGEVSIEAALNPADGSWLYFVPDFENGTTLFADTYAEHQANVAEQQEYCSQEGVDEC